MDITNLTVEEVITKILNAELDTPHEVNDIEGLEGLACIGTVDPDEHRWYTIGTVVYPIGDRFIGVRGPVHLNSESSSWDDLSIKCRVFEMVQVPSVTYKRKGN